MAEKTVVVRLKAVVDDYKRAMQSAGDATASVAQKAQGWQQLGRSTADLGDRMTRNITMPIIALGAAAVKMAADFDSTFTQMQTLAGVSADEIDGMKESVLGLAGETGKAPQELAEALYFIRSSGLEGAAALDALEMSAKGSAAGLGSTIQVADAVTSAMNAYAQSGLTAAEATDVLVATAREGKVEPAELASQMGRLVPVASSLGITFQDVGAAMATISLVGNDASASATQLAGVMAKLQRPSQQAQEQLARAGLSLDDLHSMIRERGLLETLEELKSRLGDNGFTAFLEDQQAIQGATAILGGNIEATRERFDELRNSTGATSEAFRTWAESMGAENAQAFGKLQVALIQFGDAIAPIASDVIGFLGDIASAFSDLPDWAQKAIVGFLAFAAALGPILSVGGRLVTVYGTVQKALEAFGTHLTAQAAAGFNQIGTAANAATAGTVRFSAALTRFGLAIGVLAAVGQGVDAITGGIERANLSKLERDLLDLGESGRLTGDLAALAGEDFGRLKEAIERIDAPSVATQVQNVQEEFSTLGGLLGETGHDFEIARQRIDDVDKALANLARQSPEAAAQALERLTEGLSAEEAERFLGDLDDYDSALAELETAGRTAAGGLGTATGAMDEQAVSAEVAEAALQEYLDSLTAMMDPLFGYQSALAGNRDANAAVAEAQHGLNQAIAEHGPNSLEAMAATAALTDAQFAAGQSALDLTVAEAQLKAGIEAGTVSVGQAKSMLDTWVATGLITRDTANVLGAKFDEYAAHVDAIPDHQNTHLSTSGVSWAEGQVLHFRGLLNAIPRQIMVNIGTRFATGAAGVAAQFRQHGGPVRAHHPYVVGEAGPELFISNESGTIFPNDELRQLMSRDDAVPLGGGPESTRAVLMGFGGLAAVMRQSTAELLSPLVRIQRYGEYINRGVMALIQLQYAGTRNLLVYEDLTTNYMRDRGRYVPGFHQGGVVPGAPGQEMLALLQAGERIIPAGGQAGGVTVVFQPGAISMAGAIVASGHDAQRWVSTAWNQAVRGNMVNITPSAVRQ